MTPVLPQRRRTELIAKLASFDTELEYWFNLTDKEGLGLRRYHSQVRRISATLDGVLSPTRKAINELPVNGEGVLDGAARWEDEILAARSIWEVFRSKLVLRLDDLYRDHLAACDDLAWECYRPAMERFSPRRREPPLVYFTSRSIPFAKRRDSNFQQEAVYAGGPAITLRDDEFATALRQLPVPLLGVPWYQAFYVPGALIIAHEVGHIVEWEFDLTDTIEKALENAELDQPGQWKSWASEVFADLYGTLTMGPAFVGALIDFLAAPVNFIQRETRTGGEYPTRALRIELVLEALKQRRFENAATRLRTYWEGTYGAMRTMLDYINDVAKVVSAIYAAPYGGSSLPDELKFPATADVMGIGRTAATGLNLEQSDPRQLFAAAQWLHENPQEPGDRNTAFARLVKKIIVKGRDEVRLRGAPVPDKAQMEEELKKQEEADRRAGIELRRLLFRQ
jgi:hypothetical protein